MPDRRVRVAGRGVYGRAEPLRPVKRRTVRTPVLGQWQRRAGLLLVGVLVVLWGLSQLFATNTIAVSVPSDGARVQSELQTLVGQSWWSHNLLTLNSEELASKLQQVDPAVKTAQLSRRWPHTLSAVITLKQPSLGWSTGNQFYLLDADGTVIGQLPAGTKLPVVYDGSNLPVKVGDRVVAARFVQFVEGVAAALAHQNLQATHYDVADTTFDLTVQTDKGYKVVFDTSRPLSEEAYDLTAVERTLLAQKKTPSQYIDLRISGKAYYE